MMEDDYLPSYVIDPSNLQLKEYFRKEGIVFYPVHAYAGKNNLFFIKLHYGGKFTPSPKRMYIRGKVNYVDNIDVDLFNVDELHMFIQDLGCDADVVSLINLVANCKVVEVFVEYWLTSIDHQYLSPFKSTVEIEELNDDVLLNAPVVVSSKRVALCWINEADVGESSMGKNDNVNVDENLNLDDYTVHVDENMNENVNVDENMNDNVNVDGNVNKNMNENLNADDEYDQDNVEDQEVIEQGVEQTVTPNVDLIDEALEVLDFDLFDSDVGDDTASITRRSLRKLRKTGGQSCDMLHTNLEMPIKAVQEHMEKQFQVGVSKTKVFKAKAKAEVHLKDDQEHQYAIPRDYYDALKKANLNTTVKIDVYRAYNPHENV
ncbi:hypothetical protein Tco_1020647, partial [Tanacetum coccineum]